MKVTAAVARQGDQPFTIETLELDEPRDDEILVRIVGVGLCHTDLVFKAAGLIAPPSVLGHEGSGIVEKVGAGVSKVKAGDRVAISFRSCGHCARCDRHEPAYCHTMPALNYTGFRDDGSKTLSKDGQAVAGNFFGQSSFATHALTYERNVVKVPESFPLELAGPLGCGVQTGAGSIINALKCETGSSLLIIGGGAVGLSAVMGAAVQGCGTIIVVEPMAPRRALALELGATHVIDPKAETDLPKAVRTIVPIGVDYAFDTAGIPAVLQAVMQCLGPHGTFGIVGIAPPGTPVPGDMGQVMTFGHTIKGIIEGDSDPDLFIPELMRLHSEGRLPLEKLVKTYPLKQINEAIAAQHHGDCVKVVLLTGQ
ncbi:Aryl-alcohol dehydrogenase [Alphaproteobacteria bacterium SO-S41]|nr:Aryl-alcohol dehydrogenase [Alphaproteobacteria bacterium SO-S41]